VLRICSLIMKFISSQLDFISITAVLILYSCFGQGSCLGHNCLDNDLFGMRTIGAMLSYSVWYSLRSSTGQCYFFSGHLSSEPAENTIHYYHTILPQSPHHECLHIAHISDRMGSGQCWLQGILGIPIVAKAISIMKGTSYHLKC
jgi:hypothetical protein